MHDGHMYRGFRLTFQPERALAQPPFSRGTIEPVTSEALAAWGSHPNGMPEALVTMQAESARAFYQHAESTVDAALRQPALCPSPAEAPRNRGAFADALPVTTLVADAAPLPLGPAGS